MTSNLASEEIAEYALQLREEAREVHEKRSYGEIGMYNTLYFRLSVALPTSLS